uniref:Uncharacterized protein n=1 Tax=Eucampia antarctica TaxID=49252 RepID=A0A7S2SKH3_9STRA|mmetsp:Transcript_9531/g.9178  ORF Transcript_9531/g.9178 Transcript_9531/m.9178 type:complete len:540 (+) Transcript_9531:135-1754(+)|eukprot:CAMPEP_0197828136 /NCGR_PEP_ID=MMETSP1437-20131217/4771_1 /TAXON_ID=49252 ORGANISM="Eucampia antarctica, Strain CCMP1452" /NCGR_SAMPLE_ID=MMETSP1437 /ASSEMBLY_ACC=CAM_ASM_001096 /LENGTH=539 /DNA_ID=CAMNT_0043429253 /DNA_START=89 /DNA_END=1708 /DNA_ORIENTATION=+
MPSLSCYQIEVSSASSGKHVAATKRRIRWRFGFANPKAVASGETGVECRGREHEVTLVWSFTSGKRLVMADQKEVHFSQGRRTDGKFTTSWELKGGQVITIIAHAAPPLKSKPGFKQFDLKISGCSFSELPRIYELGLNVRSNNRAITSQAPQIRKGYSNYKSSGDVEMEWARNVHEQETRRAMDRDAEEQYAATKNRRSSFVNREAANQLLTNQRVPSPVHQETSAHQSYTASSINESYSQNNNFSQSFNSTQMPHANTLDFVSEPVLPTVGNDFVSTDRSLMEQIASSTPQINTYDEFQPRELDPSQPPTYDAVWSSIMDAYDTAPPGTNLVTPTKETYHVETKEYTYEDNQSLERPQLSINTNIHIDVEENVMFFDSSSPTGVDEVNSAFKNIVNLDDLTSPADRKGQKLTMMNEETQKARKTTSALPPKAAGWNLGPSPSLAQLKNLQTGPPIERKEVMKASMIQQPAVPTQYAGALVVHALNQNTGYNNYGPPPLQQTSGFGVGATLIQNNSPHAQQQPYYGQEYNQYTNQLRC